MSEEELIEVVAKAMRARIIDGEGDPERDWKRIGGGRQMYLDDARVAIAAYREATALTSQEQNRG